jgi:hypothetical protein
MSPNIHGLLPAHTAITVSGQKRHQRQRAAIAHEERGMGRVVGVNDS